MGRWGTRRTALAVALLLAPFAQAQRPDANAVSQSATASHTVRLPAAESSPTVYHPLQSGEVIRAAGLTPLSDGMDTYAIGFVDINGKKNCMVALVGGSSVDFGSVYLYEPDGKAPDGAPVFKKTARFTFDAKSTAIFPEGKRRYKNSKVVQTPAGDIYGLWPSPKGVLRTRLNPQTLTFALEGEPLPRSFLAMSVNRDGSVDYFFTGTKRVRPSHMKGKYWEESFDPFDCKGIWNGGYSYDHVMGVRASALWSNELTAPKLVSEKEAELWKIQSMEAFATEDGKKHLLAATITGRLMHYLVKDDGTLTAPSSCKYDDGSVFRALAVRTDCELLWENGKPSLILGGECGIYYFQFVRFDADGVPVYKKGVYLRTRDEKLYCGSLPVVAAVDFNQDGLLDFVVGNSQGELLFVANMGKGGSPRFREARPMAVDGEDFVQKGEYWALHGPEESLYGYVGPAVFDWNGDGRYDILTGDSTARFGVYLNKGSNAAPNFRARKLLLCDSIAMHGTWRTRPAVAKLRNGKTAYVICDEDDQVHLYWKADNQVALTDGGKLLLKDGAPINVATGAGNASGRINFGFADIDRDGRTDLIMGAQDQGSVPNKTRGLPGCIVGRPECKSKLYGKLRFGAAILWLKNVGDDSHLVLEEPRMMRFKKDKAAGRLTYLGAHCPSADVADFGGGLQGLVVTTEEGTFLFYNFDDILWESYDDIAGETARLYGN
jgi:hypothetical protein